MIAAAGWGLTLTLILVGVGSMRGADSRMRQRVGALSQRAPEAFTTSGASVLRDRRASNFRAFDAFIRRQRWSEATRYSLERAGLRLRVGEWVLLRVFAVGFMAALLGFLGSALGDRGMVLMALVVGAVLGGMLPPFVLKFKIKRRQAQMDRQIVEMTELMASMLSSGFGYMQALMSAARQLEPPLADEVNRLVEATQVGGDADEALEEMATRLDSRDFQIVTTAISIHRKTGGDLAQILRGVASTIRGRQSFAREVSALTSKERYSAIIVAGFPLLLALALTAMMPETFGRLFTQFEGRLILGAALVMDGIGYYAIKRISRIEI